MWKILSIFGCLLIVIFLLVVRQTHAQSEQDVRNQIKELEQKLVEIGQQKKTLASQIANFDTQIKLAQLKIDQTEIEVASLSATIVKIENSITNLSVIYQKRVISSYQLNRLGDPFLSLLTAKDLPSLISRAYYLKLLQERDRDLLFNLQTSQTALETEKIALENLQKKLESQKIYLSRQIEAKNKLLEVTKNDESKYQQLLVQAKAQLAAFKRFVARQGGASLLSNQTKCDGWGCYYNQRDSQWGTMAMGNSSDTLAEYGCLVTSMAMIASHYGKSLKPADIAASPNVFFGNTGYMNQGSWTAQGVTATRTRVCASCGLDAVKQKIDNELNNGNPVVVGLYSGPDHFIVIKGKEGDNYIMNDPFVENGGNIKLTDKYNLSDIKTVDIVRVY
ncbi:C39 family peptidase [Candidatus Microgenomates bacterium]|nr:C39 family peptidase [Candidatus Microgenomates bacterium]